MMAERELKHLSEARSIADDRQYHDLIAYVETHRRDRGADGDPRVLAQIAEHMPADHFDGVAMFKAATRGMMEIHGVKKHDEFFVGLLQAPYNPSLGLEAMHFRHLAVPPFLRFHYPSQAAPIVILAATTGLQPNRQVALFPENFRLPSAEAWGHQVFYFISKFTTRFYHRTLPVIQSPRLSPYAFPCLLKAEPDRVEKCAIIWTYLHEHFHGRGILPITENFAIKSARSTAALEELRVDILAMLEILHGFGKYGISHFDRQTMVEFIFAERLLCYPMEAHPQDDYDARSSIVFFSLLEAKSAIFFQDGLLHVDWQEVPRALDAIADEIACREQQAQESLPSEQRKPLIDYVRRHSHIDARTGLFLRPSFYDMVNRGDTV